MSEPTGEDVTATERDLEAAALAIAAHREAESEPDYYGEARVVIAALRDDRCPTCSAADRDDQDCGGVGPGCVDTWHGRETTDG